MVKNRKCMACGTKYSYCPDCSRADALKPTWYNNFCNESCKDLWMTISRYSMDRITKADAKSAILELDLKSIESYSQFIQKDYAKIMVEEKKPRRGKRIEVQPVDEIADVSKEVVESVVQDLVEIKPEQPVVAEPVVEEATAHEVVIEKEK
jgi:hypothetical protein